MDPETEEALREAAAGWFARMQGPDAERSRPAFRAWLSESPNHKRAYDRMVASWQRARLITHTETGQAWQGLPARAKPRRPVWVYAIAASITLLLFVGLLLAHGASNRAPTIAAAQELASPVGIRTVRLGDGSVVTLDAGARLELRYSAKERRIVLGEGRARFEVAQDAARPFVVAAADREVVATGTVFDVSCTDGKVTVALLRGGLDVRTIGAEKAQAVTHLVAGETVQLASGGGQSRPEATVPGALAWPSGMIDFDGTPLRDVVATANRYSSRHIVLADPALGDLKVTGGFKVGDAAALAAGLAAAFDLDVVAAGEGDLALRPRR